VGKEERYVKILERFDQLTGELGDPEVIKNQPLFKKKALERSGLEDAAEKIKKYRELEKRYQEDQKAIEISDDRDIIELAGAEIKELKEEMANLENDIELALLPTDPDDSRNTVVEIRAGTGGDEAAIFAGELARMYRRFAEKENWRVEVLGTSPNEGGGFKEIIILIRGNRAFGKLKFERGVHRVQRVPVTESGGRIHTSAVSVAVLPEAEEVDVGIDPRDLRIDVFRSRGPGGQSVNMTDSAVRITHKPSGIVVSCQDEKSQHKNRAKAMKVLRSRLLERARSEQEKKIAEARRSMIGSGDRSDKVRTYNFPQGRVTDHRIGLSVHNLEAVLDGDLGEIINALAIAQRDKLIEEAMGKE
jgi:peptide chain release factor 1